MKAHFLPFAVGALSLSPLGGCGASLQAVYEGDVRFERCMSLDVQPQVSAAVRRDCWKEWVSFYTYGQTRDRVIHAQLRIKQLAGESPGPPGDNPRGSLNAPLDAPGPTTALSPPQMMTRDPGNSPDAEGARCLSDCQAESEECGRACNDEACLRVCNTAHTSCTQRCS